MARPSATAAMDLSVRSDAFLRRAISSGQIHRTFSLGEPTKEWRELHDVAMEGYLAIEDTLKDGATTSDIENASEIIHQRGYSIYDDLLHGVSQTPPIIQTRTTRRHENPDITFRENMVITIQPNVMTLDEKMGLQFGETVVVTKTGCERLNAYPRELQAHHSDPDDQTA